MGELVLVGGIEAAQGQGEVIAQAHIGESLGVAAVQGGGELIAPLEHLENDMRFMRSRCLMPSGLSD